MKLKLSPHHTVLIVIDMQKDLYAPDGISAMRGRKVSHMQRLPEKINQFLKHIHSQVKLIVFTQYISGQNITPPNLALLAKMNNYSLLCKKGSRGEAFEGVSPPRGALIVQKPHYDAFAYTNLKNLFVSNKIKNVLVCGVRTEVCVEPTAKRAASEGFNTYIIKDLVATYDDKLRLHHEIFAHFAKYYGFVMSSHQILALLK